MLIPRLPGSITSSLTFTTAWAGPVLDAYTRLEREIVIGTDDRTSTRRIADKRLSGISRWARRVGSGQAVLAGPEGNEFCVIGPNETLTR